MQVELSAEAKAAMESLLRNGWYTSAEQIVDVPVGRLLEEEPNNAGLRVLVREGIDSMQNEPVITGEQSLAELAARRLKRA